jgi:ribosomal protein S18 acetylase RimI-like enzyme
MTPIFNGDNHLVAWFDGTYVFDLNTDWVAFHSHGHVFASTGGWLGALHQGSFLDHEGRPVAWLTGGRPMGGMRPSAPMNAMRPMAPKRPLRPRTPLPPSRPLPPSGGWSELTWQEWLGKAPLAEPSAIDPATIRIEPLEPSGHEAFFAYLDDHASDNGRDGQYFQPMSRAESRFTVERQQAFRAGLGVPAGGHGWRRAWVARDARDRVVGHVDLRSHPERFTAHRCLLGMGVDRDHRRLGLGARLLAQAEQWAAAEGLKWLDLRVLSSNEAAVALYRKVGFQMNGGTPDMFVIDGQSFGYVAMSRKLTAAR